MDIQVIPLSELPTDAPELLTKCCDSGQAVVGLDPIEVVAGGLPRRQRRLVEAWAELHQKELIADWRRLQAGQPPLPIAPLE